MSANQVKILVSVFFVLAFWRLFELPGVATAFWAFCTVGAIPGTTTILGFETVARLSIVLFVLIILGVFRRELLASLPHTWYEEPTRHASVPKLAAIAVPSALQQDTTTREEIIVIALNTQVSRPGLGLLRPLLLKGVWVLAWIIHLVCNIEHFMHLGILGAWRCVKHASIAGYGLSRRGVIAGYRLLRRGAIMALHLIITLWKLCEPYVRTFDGYLEDLLHSNKYSSEVLRTMHDASKVVSTAYQKAHDTTRKITDIK